MRFFPLAFLIFVCGCGRQNTTNGNIGDTDKKDQFNVFLAKFKSRQLPIRIRGCDEMIYPDSAKLDYGRDTVLETLQGYAYGTIKTNGDYTAVISLAAADCLLPTLTTFSKEGKKIDEKTIAIGQCGSGPGFTCHETMIIGSDYSLFTSDTITTEEVDSLGEVVPSTAISYVIYRKGKILANGKIELSEEITDSLKRK